MGHREKTQYNYNPAESKLLVYESLTGSILYLMQTTVDTTVIWKDRSWFYEWQEGEENIKKLGEVMWFSSEILWSLSWCMFIAADPNLRNDCEITLESNFYEFMADTLTYMGYHGLTVLFIIRARWHRVWVLM